MAEEVKLVAWIGSTKKDLLAMPEAVQKEIGFILFQVQCGRMPPEAKPLKGFGGASVQEIVVDYDRTTFRAVHTSALPNGFTCSMSSRKKPSRVSLHRSLILR